MSSTEFDNDTNLHLEFDKDKQIQISKDSKPEITTTKKSYSCVEESSTSIKGKNYIHG